MKKVIAVLLLCVLLAGGAAQGEDMNTYSVTFRENPTTGYAWCFTITDDTVLVVEDAGYVPAETTDEMVGTGGTHCWRVTAQQAGEAAVTFTYTRSWESDPSDPVVTLTFAADADLALTLVDEEGMPQRYMPDKAVIRLLENPTTGYAWAAEPGSTELLHTSCYFSPESTAEGTPCSGVHTWIYEGIAEGTATLTFRYARFFELNRKPKATVKYTYLVDAQHNVTLLGIDGDYAQYDPDAKPVAE